jgi:hypothetical protein
MNQARRDCSKHGRYFLFYLAPADKDSNPVATGVVLAAAARLDQAIPAAALRND